MAEDCGHTEEEHQAMAEQLQANLMTGDLTPLIPTLSNQALMVLLQAVSAEVFIRAEDDEEAQKIWTVHDDLVRGTFFANAAEDSDNPVIFSHMREARKRFKQEVENMKFAAEASGELNTILEQHGVQPAPPEKEDDFPGFYL